MATILKNDTLEINIDHPLENYQTARFDWTGKISEIKYLGIPVTVTEKNDDQDENLFGRGLYNEFGIDTALGFTDAEIGDWFHKIGVGLLKKVATDYEFFHDYEIRPAVFSVTTQRNRMSITCISELHNGYSYELTKEIILTDNQFIIQYVLKNTGEKEIISDEYVHNFMGINNALLDNQYCLKLPFQIAPEKFNFTVNPEKLISFSNNEISFGCSINQQFLISHLGGSEFRPSEWTLLHREQKIGIKEVGNFPTNKINLWGWSHVISPELFHHIQLKPGDSEVWSRTYHFFQID